MRPLAQDDFYNYTFLSGLSLSADGKAAVTAATVNAEKNDYDRAIWLERDGGFFRLTAGGSEGSWFWEDEENILFAADRSEDEKKRRKEGEQFTALYRIGANGGEALKAYELPFAAGTFKKLEDGRYAVSGRFSKDCPDYYAMDGESRKAEDKRRKEEKDYEVCDESPFWFNGAGFINGSGTAVYVWDPRDGSIVRATEENFDADGFEVFPGEIVYWGDEKGTVGREKGLIRSYSLESGDNRPVREDRKYAVRGVFNVGGRAVAYMSDCETYGVNQDGSFYLMDLLTGEEKLILASVGVGNATGSDCRLGRTRSVKACGDRLYYIETRRNAAVLCSTDLDGNVKDHWTSEGAVEDFDVSECGRLVMTRMTASALQEVYDAEGNRISDFNGKALDDAYVAMPEKLTVMSRGTDIDGWVLKPYAYESGKKYPAVLDIHGGPRTVYGEVFYHEMQYWASLGYFVFFCNPIGGDGRGDAFADIRGKYGTVDYENIMDFTDEVLRQYPDIDPARVCVTGGSYGGYMTNWIIGHTDRFCCAATQRSISNWVSFCGVSDIGYRFGFDQCAADIENGMEKLWWHSPLKYAGNAVTPTLFIHSDEDYRCPLEQGIQMYTALLNKGVEARMCIFHGENHELSRGGKPKHRSRRLKEITDWFERFAK